MIVSELIEALQKMPQDARIAISDDAGHPWASNKILVSIGDATDQVWDGPNLRNVKVPDCVILD